MYIIIHQLLSLGREMFAHFSNNYHSAECRYLCTLGVQGMLLFYILTDFLAVSQQQCLCMQLHISQVADSVIVYNLVRLSTFYMVRPWNQGFPNLFLALISANVLHYFWVCVVFKALLLNNKLKCLDSTTTLALLLDPWYPVCECCNTTILSRATYKFTPFIAQSIMWLDKSSRKRIAILFDFRF